MSRKNQAGYFVQGQFVRRGSAEDQALSTTEVPSKTQRKKDSDARQKLGEKLVSFSPQVWAKLDLPEPLIEALQDCKAIPPRAFPALRRQYQLIGKLMHQVDAEALRAKMQQLLLLAR